MAGQPYTRVTERFKASGVDLNSPLDSIRPGYYPVLENVRSYTDGIIQPRQGLTLINNVVSSKTPVHSVRRLNDPNSGNFQRIVGSGDALAYGTTSFTRATYAATSSTSTNVIFSGNPLIMVPFRPDQSISSWMYIADSAVMRKIIGENPQGASVGLGVGTVHQIGLAPPTTAPTVELGALRSGAPYNISAGLGSSPNNWKLDGTVFTTAAAVVGRVPAGDTITKVIFDSGTSGWASMLLSTTTMAVVGIGMLFYAFDGGATHPLVIQEIYAGSVDTGITVGAILYDNSPTNTGTCTIYPDKSVREIRRNALVYLNGATYARITDVIPGPDGTIAFRCSTGATTIAAAATLVVKPTVRVYDEAAGVADANTIFDSSAAGTGTISTGGAGTAAFKTGWAQIVPVAGLIDLTKLSLWAGSTGDALTDDDWLHVSLQYSDLSKLVQGRLMFDCDGTSLTVTGATNATPIVVTTSASHLLADGNCVYITGVLVNGNANGTFYVTVLSATTFSLQSDQARATNVAGSGVYGGGGTVKTLFNRNFYYHAFTPNDILTAAKGTQTAFDNRTDTVNKRIIDGSGVGGPLPLRPGRDISTMPVVMPSEEGPIRIIPDQPEVSRGTGSDDVNITPIDTPSGSQTGSGDQQWSEIRFRRGQLVRVGSDTSRGLGNITAMRIELTMLDTTAFTTRFNSFTAWGGFEPDLTDLAIPYIYRYRYRMSYTGAVSNWSPANRTGVLPQRGKISVTATAPTATEVNTIDFQRLGGSNTTWLTVGSSPSGTLTFTDKISDIAAAGSASLSEGDTNYQPWPIIAKPIAGTADSVVGPYLKDTGTPDFNVAWAKGTPIIVGGINTQIRRVVSTSVIELDDSLGSLGGVVWEIPEPILTGQYLPTLWEWNNIGFACGDTNNPGYLYFTNGNSLDTTQDTFHIEVTAPSEPLINGCNFNGKNYVWSSERMFEIDSLGPNNFIPLVVPGGKGLISRYGLATGERMWFISRDGIYQSNGGECISITDETLRPLFMREGNAGLAVNGFNPPDLTSTTKLRLSYYKGYLYFVYLDTNSDLRCMAYPVRADKPGWWPDVYGGASRGLTYIYGEEGSGANLLLGCGNDATTGALYSLSGAADGSTAIPCRLRTQYFDAQDRRADKHWGDLIIDADPNNATITAAAYINNSTSTSLALTPTTMTGSSRAQQVFDISSGGDPAAAYSRNMALDVSWSSTGSTPKLFLWEPSYTVRPESIDLRASSWDDDGYMGDKFFQGIEIDANTFGASRSIVIEYDGSTGNVADTLTVAHTNRQQVAYAFRPAFIAHTVRLHPSDGSNSWALYGYKWVWQPEPPKADRWETQQTSLGYDQFLHLKSAFVCLRSTQNVTFTVTRTEDSDTNTYTIPTTSGLRKRVYVPFVATKGKSFSFVLSTTSTGGTFRLYKSDTAVLAKPWASEEAFVNRNPFGAAHGDGKAEI